MTISTPTIPLDDASWEAITRRDRTVEFVYAVTTTGIYCRPSCPARRAHRDHVLVFASPDLAHSSGFRPCRRCRPDEPGSDADPRGELVAGVCAQIAAATGRVPLADLAAAAGCSRHHLLRVFRSATGVTPGQYQAARRLRRAGTLMAGATTVTDAIYGAGYGAGRGFYQGARAGLGMAPATYLSGGAGATIWYATVDSRLGQLLVATTTAGLCAVEFSGDDAREALALRFPAAELVWAPARLAPLTEALSQHIDGRRLLGALPVDVPATSFQALVWAELRRIPAGQTRSYQDVAAALGSPGAARAVGRACAANPVAVAVPCHRVIGSDGSAGGYRWGLARKLSLLATEAEFAASGSASGGAFRGPERGAGATPS
ncbi:MAG: bifunctional transcriptional activator/DNA repair enzyme AdaA [Candidatus Dormibacteria bacterium]